MRGAPTATRAFAVLLLTCGVSAGVDGATQDRTPMCFGAAARDPLTPCVNRKLDYAARPTPYNAPLESVAPCAMVRSADPGICEFGVSRQNASATVAIVGDSHAVHWRPAMSVVARVRRWRGLSITRSNCPFSFAKTPLAKGHCKGWARGVVRWLADHPNIHTVFVSAHSGANVVATHGTYDETKVSGYIRAWEALPSSVDEVLVIHDVPRSSNHTRRCVQGAVTHDQKPGLLCARPRHAALRPDLEVSAAEKAAAARVKVIDLTPFMCDDRSCFPVVGGVLVNKDLDHLTRVFSSTLGKFLGRAVTQLRAWG